MRQYFILAHFGDSARSHLTGWILDFVSEIRKTRLICKNWPRDVGTP